MEGGRSLAAAAAATRGQREEAAKTTPRFNNFTPAVTSLRIPPEELRRRNPERSFPMCPTCEAALRCSRRDGLEVGLFPEIQSGAVRSAYS